MNIIATFDPARGDPCVQQCLYDVHDISQIQLLNGGRAIFAGVAENDRPGSIQVINMKWQKISEIQAHSLPIERIRVSHDNQYLYSAGQDGVFGTFTISDKDPNKKDKEFSNQV